ncbi:hypothetical protein [Paraflavitalea pollutisoli]|uniref:hypothetical protein n=1 Tax=Paraflavitalea pollutisoli TaxID=3034143 RepID=UPI0023ECD0E3|nr:hypothetical protein [Paraflavitalea sp. H1-2-19X]
MKTTALTHYLAGLCLIILAGCSKNNTETPVDPNPVEEKTATFITTNATPGGSVVLETSFPLSSATYKITVGGKPATLVKLNNQQAGFILPVVPAGAITVDLTAIGVKPAAYTVGTYSAITEAQPVISSFISDLNKAVALLEKQQEDTIRQVSASRVAMAKSLRDNFQALYATLPDADRLELAYHLQQMKFNGSDPLVNGKQVMNTTNLRDPADRLVTLGELVITHTTLTISGMAIAVIGFYAPEPTLLSKVLGIAAGAFAVANLAQTWRLIDEFADEFGKQTQFKELSTDGGRVAQPAGQQARADNVKMMNKVALQFSFTSEFQTFSSQDAQSTNAFTKSIFTALDKLSVSYEKFSAAVNYAKSWFSAGAPALETYVSPIRKTPASTTMITPSSKLSFNNVSDPGIQVTYVNNADNTVTIKASSETVKTEKTFSFDVVYNHAKLGISNKKTINATFNPNSNEWMARLIGSNWKLTYYLRMTPQKYQEYTASYNRNPDGASYVPDTDNRLRIKDYPTEISFKSDSTFSGVGTFPYGYQQKVSINAPNKWQVSATGAIWSRFTAAKDQPDFHLVTGQLEVIDTKTIKVKMQLFTCDCEEPFSILQKQ